MADRPEYDSTEALWRDIRSRHPLFTQAVLSDAVTTCQHRGERWEFRSKADAVLQIIRLVWVSDAFLAQIFYRAKAAMQRRRIPLLPRIAHRLCMVLSQVTIGDPVVVHPGIYIVHGQVVFDGLVEIHGGTVFSPWVSIGLKAGSIEGPTIRTGARVGTGACVLGPVEVGEGAVVGANSVVVHDVPPGVTVVGAPAKPV